MGFAGGARRVLDEVVLQGTLVSGQFGGLAFPGQTPDLLQTARQELVEVALHRAAGDIGETGNVLVDKALTFEPQDLQLLLDTGMRIVVALVADGSEIFRGESEAAHSGPQSSTCPAAYYEP
jgi:hypothetical protein